MHGCIIRSVLCARVHARVRICICVRGHMHGGSVLASCICIRMDMYMHLRALYVHVRASACIVRASACMVRALVLASISDWVSIYPAPHVALYV